MSGRAATCSLHICRSLAVSLISPQVFPISLISFSTVRHHVILGWPLLRFPSGIQCKAVFAMEASWGVTWPIHLQHPLIRMVALVQFHTVQRDLYLRWREAKRCVVYAEGSWCEMWRVLINPSPLSANILNHTGELWGRSCDRVSAWYEYCKWGSAKPYSSCLTNLWPCRDGSGYPGHFLHLYWWCCQDR